jgi:indole-3-glycerol phosphate synthase
LRTFKTDLATTTRLAEFVEDKSILVAESGIRDRADVQRLNAAGVRILLVGETLMRSNDIGGMMAKLKGIFRQS